VRRALQNVERAYYKINIRIQIKTYKSHAQYEKKSNSFWEKVELTMRRALQNMKRTYHKTNTKNTNKNANQNKKSCAQYQKSPTHYEKSPTKYQNSLPQNN